MNPSPDELFHFWLLLRWVLPLLTVALISYIFVINYLHERAQTMSAIAKLANLREEGSLWEAPTAMPEARTRAQQAVLRDEFRVSTGPERKAGRSSGLAPSATFAWSSRKGESEAPATSVERRRVIDASLLQKRSS